MEAEVTVCRSPHLLNQQSLKNMFSLIPLNAMLTRAIAPLHENDSSNGWLNAAHHLKDKEMCYLNEVDYKIMVY